MIDPIMTDPATTIPCDEPHRSGITGRLNWLRAGVLGANDGIVSVAAIVVGVAGATSAVAPILTAGVAGLVGGAISMALGEYVSVSSQRDSQRALIAKETARTRRDARGGTRRADGDLPRRRVCRRATAGRCRRADRPRRARRAPRGRTRHHRDGHRQPVAGGGGIRAGLHDRRDAAMLAILLPSGIRSDPHHVRRGAARARPDRNPERPHRRGKAAGARRCASSSAARPR